MTKKNDVCTSCGKKWIDHLGIIGTCKHLQEAKSALQIIHTWASYKDGLVLDADHIVELTEKTLKNIG